MRILIAHNYTSASYSVLSFTLANELAASGHQVLFLSHEPAVPQAFYPHNNLEVAGWPEKRPDGWKSFQYYLKTHKRFKPDLVLIHNAPKYVAGIGSWLLGCKHRWIYYHTAEEANKADNQRPEWFYRLMLLRKRSLYFFYNRVICVSHFAQQDIARFFKVPASKCMVAHNALPDRYSHHTEKKAANPVIFHLLARFDACKRVAETIDAFIAFRQQTQAHAFLVVAGGGALENTIRQKAAADANIEIRSALPYNEVDNFIQESHWLLCPSLTESFGVVNVEAIMNATPVLANKVGGIPEIIKNGVNGLLADSLSTQAWITLFSKAYHLTTQKPADYEEMRKNGRQIFLQKFTLQQYVNSMQQAIEAL